jgi:hypothetical protein
MKQIKSSGNLKAHIISLNDKKTHDERKTCNLNMQKTANVTLVSLAQVHIISVKEAKLQKQISCVKKKMIDY